MTITQQYTRLAGCNKSCIKTFKGTLIIELVVVGDVEMLVGIEGVQLESQGNCESGRENKSIEVKMA